MIISIVGAGALGKTYGGLLAQQHEVHYLMRSEYAQVKREGGFTLVFPPPQNSMQIEAPLLHQDAKTLPPSDLVIISTKTTANHELGALLGHCIKENTLVLVIQNGIGNEEWISQLVPHNPLICGVSSMKATRLENNTVEIAYIAELRLAPFQAATEKQCEIIEQAFAATSPAIPVKAYQSYKEIRWRKLIWNVPFSALSIIYQQDTQVLATRQPYVSIVRALMNEVADIAKADGVTISQEHMAKMLEATQKSGPYYPSMYFDSIQGKPIEKEYIIDNVLALARQYHIETPMLNLIQTNLN
ncbi:2-dehydropantoate 2-reductase [Candidatus Berkiella aquae]|uniref:2-dehydropantoate 2-reductase n=1 Tax=Candidatus Berkiella aquae TaxID=295108 RepID=A0A0Q9YIC7_9GAMM|nr:2-dehydropantoate 2-reductase [Candidatus Berkiella aquae]MCS5712299.1 2-dehydropantoate 2-reductase [Candidatus Berkiella aquae]